MFGSKPRNALTLGGLVQQPQTYQNALAQALSGQQPITLAQLAQWQQRYALPNWRNMLTTLPPQQEAQFETWASQNHAPITPDYDMRGYWLHRNDPNNQTAINPNDHQLHFPDTYKTPLHQSFSGESIFANPQSRPPMWNDKDQLVTFDGRVLYDERAANRRRK